MLCLKGRKSPHPPTPPQPPFQNKTKQTKRVLILLLASDSVCILHTRHNVSNYLVHHKNKNKQKMFSTFNIKSILHLQFWLCSLLPVGQNTIQKSSSFAINNTGASIIVRLLQMRQETVLEPQTLTWTIRCRILSLPLDRWARIFNDTSCIWKWSATKKKHVHRRD